MNERNDAAVSWLLDSTEPAVRQMTRRDVLGEPDANDRGQVLAGPKVTALLSGQQPDGGFGVHYYRKWTGAHWRLISLTELEIPANEPRAVAAAGRLLVEATRQLPDAGSRRLGPIRPNEMITLNALRVLRAAGRLA